MGVGVGGGRVVWPNGTPRPPLQTYLALIFAHSYVVEGDAIGEGSTALARAISLVNVCSADRCREIIW